ncbi:MAG: NAD(P)-dependent oxidoreductase [Deltaproteobacteria bacterium]|nr:NAD(P)-dependent oxidoreductase [Deltaproteobacteria bacterium]
MRVFITGAGLIGSHSAKELTEKGHRVWFYDLSPNVKYIEAVAGKKNIHVLQGDLLDLPALLRGMKEARPDVVVHTAGFIGSQVSNPPYRGVRTNILGSTNVFEACQLSRVGRIVHISTFGVYDWENIRRGPVSESFPRGGRTFYGATKVANELLLGAYESFYDLETVVIRPASAYGPGHYRGGSGGGKNMSDLARACLSDGPITLYEKRIGSNDFVYAGDVGRGVALACVKEKAAGKAFNIGSGEIYGPEDFKRVLLKILPGREITVAKDDAAGRAGNERLRLDLSQSSRVLGYAPKYPLEKGLRDYLDHCRRFGFWA